MIFYAYRVVITFFSIFLELQINLNYYLGFHYLSKNTQQKVINYHNIGTLIPPSTLQTAPDAYPFQITSRTDRANHSGFPSIPNGIAILHIIFFISGEIESLIGVSKNPGAIVITRTFFGPKSLAIGNVIALMAPFVAPYPTWTGSPSSAKMLDTLIISPLYPFTSGWVIICFAACLLTLNVPITFIFKICNIASLDPTCFYGVNVKLGMNTPALFNTTSIFPYFFTVKSISQMTLFSSVTSTFKKSHFVSSAICFPFASLMSALTTFASKDLKYLTVASPSPDDPPVTMATKFLSILIYECRFLFIKIFLVIQSCLTSDKKLFQQTHIIFYLNKFMIQAK